MRLIGHSLLAGEGRGRTRSLAEDVQVAHRIKDVVVAEGLVRQAGSCSRLLAMDNLFNLLQSLPLLVGNSVPVVLRTEARANLRPGCDVMVPTTLLSFFTWRLS